MRDRLLAVALATLVVASMAVGAVGGVAAAATQDDEPDADEPLGDADDAYVTDDGDVILVYENNDTGAGTEVSYGLDVGESVFHALVVTNDTGSTNVTGDATAVLTPDRFVGNGSLTAPQPDAVESLTFDATATQTDENAEADLSLSTTLNDSETGVTGVVETADLSTRASLAPETFAVNGSFDAQLTAPLGTPQEQSFEITESDSGYTLTAAQNYTVSEFARDRWESREAAMRTLEAQYGSLASSLDGESTVTIEEYEFTNTSGPGDRARLDIAFTVEYTGIEEGLRQQIVSSLVDAEDVNLTEAESEQVAEQLTELQVDEISASLDAGETSYEGEFAVRLSEYEGAIRSGLTVAEATEPPETGPEAADPLGQVDFDRVRDTLDARAESGLVETYTLDASVEGADAGTTLDVTASYRTENWADYREALAERNISTGSSELSLHAETEGDEIVAEGSITVEQDRLVRDALDSLSNSTNASEDSEARRFIEAFRNADLRKARMDVSVTRDEMRIEAGAAFEDMAAFRDAFSETTGTDLTVASAVGRTENGTTTSYVRVVGAVDGNASNVTESDVRALGPVTENTTVHLPGTYNRTFPEADVRGSYEYLGLEYSTPTEPTASPGQPGFGVVAAATALVAAGLLAARRGRTRYLVAATPPALLFFRAGVRHRTVRRRAERLPVLREHAGRVVRLGVVPRRQPRLDLLVGQVDGHRPVVDVDGDRITVLQRADGTADERLRRDVADHRPPRRAGEPAVREQRHVVLVAGPDDCGRDAEHLAHPRAPLRSLVADGDDVAGLDLSLLNVRHRGLLVLEDANRPLVVPLVLAGDLQDRAVGREVAGEYLDGTLLVERVGDGPEEVRIELLVRRELAPTFEFGQLLADRPPGDRRRVAVHVAALDEPTDHDRHATEFVEVVHYAGPARLEIGDLRRPSTDLVELLDREVDPGLGGQREQVEHGVGRAADGDLEGDRILEALLAEEVRRFALFLNDLDSEFAAFAGDGVP